MVVGLLATMKAAGPMCRWIRPIAERLGTSPEDRRAAVVLTGRDGGQALSGLADGLAGESNARRWTWLRRGSGGRVQSDANPNRPTSG